jgi:N-acyl-D-amino-acid deacylase
MPYRFRHLFLSVLYLLGLTPMLHLDAAASEEPPITGKAVPRLRSLDRLMLDFLRDYNVPGGSLAIAKDGRLVFARGYGWANVENKRPMRPTSRFNLASCSKPITAAAILKLVDQGKLRLDDKVFALLDDIKPPPGARADPRLKEITVRQLLHHAGGLVRGQLHGPYPKIERLLQVHPPFTLAQVIRVNLDKPLLCAPGAEAHYSNLGFGVLRVVVARISGQEYEKFTAVNVLRPMGIADAHLDRNEGYWPNEAHRYAGGKRHPGGHGEVKGGAGSWVLSTIDVMRFLTSLDGSRGARVLSARAYQQMLAPLPSLGKQANQRHNGLGWDIVQRFPEGVLFSKNGGVAGITTWMEHLPNGVSWALFFNGNLKGADEEEQPRKSGHKKPWPILREAIENIADWPDHDLFSGT